MKTMLTAACLVAMVAAMLGEAWAGETLKFVAGGEAKLVREDGKTWRRGEGFLECTGVDNYLYAARDLGDGAFRVSARISIAKIEGTAASLVLGGSHFGFDSRTGQMFAEGGPFGKTRSVGKIADFIKPGVPFTAGAIYEKDQIVLSIDGKEVLRQKMGGGFPGSLALRPWRSTMRVYEFEAAGDFVEPLPHVAVFTSGTEGHHTYRIPALLVTKKGTLLAFCEGRKGSRSDTGDINMLVKRSTDGGRTWSKPLVIWDDAGNTCGNPCPVVDQDTGTIWLPMTWNLGTDREPKIITQESKDTRRVFITHSTDDGLTWAKSTDITKTTKKPNWTWYATGPCTGIQLGKGPHKGRLVIPCDHIEAASKRYYSHVIYSDDHGKTWQLGGRTPTDKVNECQAAELADGSLMLNMRNYDRSKRARAVSVSSDAGMTWSPLRRDPVLVEPICQASFIRYTLAEGGGKNRLLFSNPASAGSRTRMTVRLSYDEGKTWSISRLVNGGGSAYSCLTVLPNGDIGLLYESGGYRTIEFVRLTLDWLTRGADKLP